MILQGSYNNCLCEKLQHLHCNQKYSHLTCTCFCCPLGASIDSNVRMVGGKTTEGFCLTLPELMWMSLYFSRRKKFRGKGNKEGALQAVRNLQEDGLGQLKEKEHKSKTDKTNKSSIKVLMYTV